MPFVAEFDLAVMTGHAFQSFITTDDLRASLRTIRRALVPGGLFVFETRNPAARVGSMGDDAGQLRDRSLSSPVQVSYDILDVTGDVVTLTETTATPDGTVLRVEHGQLRFLAPERLAMKLEEAGFVIDEQVGDWDESPLSPTSREVITVARAA